jgi:hypothetical protein
MSETYTPRLYEDVAPKKGYFFLVPWMLIGTLWVRLNTGIDPGVVDFYFSLLVAGSLCLVIAGFAEPRFNKELSRLKLLPFLEMFSIGMVAIFIAFMFMQAFSGEISFKQYNPTVCSNFIAMTILLVAPVETLVFQYIIPKLTTMQLASAGLQTLGGLLSQVTFGMFHYVAYDHNVWSMVMAIFLGMGFYALVRTSKTWGLGAAMGVHAGWNIAVSVFNVSIIFSGALGGVLT